MTELVWRGKYLDGRRVEPSREPVPFTLREHHGEAAVEQLAHDFGRIFLDEFAAAGDEAATHRFARLRRRHDSGVPAALGGSVTFTVAVLGAPPPTYQWSRNGVVIPGATAASLTIASVVATDAGGNPDVVRDGETGWLVPVGDGAALAAAIAECLEDEGEAKRRLFLLQVNMAGWCSLYKASLCRTGALINSKHSLYKASDRLHKDFQGPPNSPSFQSNHSIVP